MVFDKRRTRAGGAHRHPVRQVGRGLSRPQGHPQRVRAPALAAARERIESICRTAFRALWLRDYARLDVRVAPDGEVWFLEANANPFISYGHDMANAADKAGMDYYEFIQRLVDEAVARYDHA